MQPFGMFPLLPAYGRDYTSAKAAEQDFKAGKDFQTAFGQYCSRRDFELGTRITLRFKNKRSSHTFVLD